jgi:ribosomal protein L11 methylase PrmA
VTTPRPLHSHIVRILSDEFLERYPRQPVRILDVGFGDGRLLARVCQEFAGSEPYGRDVDEAAVRAPRFC